MADHRTRVRSEPAAPYQGGVEGLAARYREPLVRWFLRRGLTSEAAEDCAHETFARICATHGGDGSAIENPDAYLFAIAASVLADRGRRARVRHEVEHGPIDDLPLVSEAPSPARVFEGREALMRLAAILDELSPRTREMFLLNRLDGLSYTQLATRFGITVSGVEKQMMKAIAHLHRRFPRDG